MFIPLCIQVGNTDNPCRCKIVGPTLAFIACIVAAIICWPLGALIYCCNKPAADGLFRFPIENVNYPVSSAIPF